MGFPARFRGFHPLKKILKNLDPGHKKVAFRVAQKTTLHSGTPLNRTYSATTKVSLSTSAAPIFTR